MATLAALSDALVRGTEVMPSAAQAGVSDKWARRALEALPGYIEAFARILDEARGLDPELEVKRLAAEDPEALALLLLVVVGAYYMSPRVRRVLGYPGPKRQPAQEDEADYYLRDGLVDPVIGRGPIYRPTPGRGASAD
jgi:hypothetical protein